MKVLGIYGFVRDFPTSTNIDIFKDYNLFAYLPQLKYENKDEIIDESYIKNYYYKSIHTDHNIQIWNYSTEEFHKKKPDYVPQFNLFYQQSYRIYSMFYHIKKICELIKKNINECEYVIICRSDLAISNIDEMEIKNGLEKHDLIVSGVNDHFFVFKFEIIDVFINLYDDFTKYLYDFYHSNLTFPSGSWRPECVLGHHYKVNNLKILDKTVYCGYINHNCSIYCGHNGHYTKTQYIENPITTLTNKDNIAFCFKGLSKGIHYNWAIGKTFVNYENCLENYNRTLFKIGNYKNNTFLSTFISNEYVEKLKVDFSCRNIINRELEYEDREKRILDFKELLQGTDYEWYIITRFDLHFNVDFEKLKFNKNKINVLVELETPSVIDDNFYCIHKSKIDLFFNKIETFINTKQYDKELSNFRLHLKKLFGEENINILLPEHGKIVRHLKCFRIV